MDYKRTKEYLPRVYHTRQIDEELRESYRTLEKRLFHEGRIVTPSLISENNMLPFFQVVGLKPFLTLNEPICPRFVVEFYIVFLKSKEILVWGSDFITLSSSLEHVENGVIELYFVNTEYQLADIFTKALGRERIEFLINKLRMRSFTPETLKQLAYEVDE
ncbi:hypothetical protein Tco_0428470 [Tanacetum coccineum]